MSTDPSGGAPSWVEVLNASVAGVSCPAPSLCIAGDISGSLDMSTDPTEGPWVNPTPDPGRSSISCPSTRMCVAAYRTGRVTLGLNPPTVTLGPVVSIGPTSATLTGTVNPNGFDVTDCHFAWGVGTQGGVPNVVPCNPYPGSGTSDVTVTATLTGLTPQTTYEYTLFAYNAAGFGGTIFPSFKTTATPPPPAPLPTRTLTVSVPGPGSGTVTSSPSGIDCGTVCSHAFAQSTVVTLTAHPAAGSTFGYWSGSCPSAAPCSIALDADSTITAVFYRLAPSCEVPKVKGKKLAAAESAIRHRHCSVGKVSKRYSTRVRKGRVMGQKPGPGIHATGTKVKLTVSKGRKHKP